jgi:hypothetical protein
VADTPVAPPNPFQGGGTEQNIDRQKALLNDMIAMEGQNARQIYERQAPDAQNLLNQQLAGQGGQHSPDARKAVYDAFIRDAQSAEGQHKRTLERQTALNAAFMDQAKAAVPIHAKEVDYATEAMRLQYEERARREAEAAAAQRAARSQASSAKSFESKLQAALEGVAIDKEVSKAQLGGVPKTEWTPKDAAAVGAKGKPGDINKFAREQSIPETWTNSRKGKEILGTLKPVIEGMIRDNLSFGETATLLQQMMADDPASFGDFEIYGNLVLGAYAPVWGGTWDEMLGGEVFGPHRSRLQAAHQGQAQNPFRGQAPKQSTIKPKSSQGLSRKY